MVTNINCVYAGTKTLHITRFTAALPVTAWNWNNQTPYAHRNLAYWSGSEWHGASGTLFDKTIGMTTYDLGTLTGLDTSNKQFFYDMELGIFLSAPTVGNATSGASQAVYTTSNVFSQTGGTITQPYTKFTQFTMPIGANTGFPATNFGGPGFGGRKGFWPHVYLGNAGIIYAYTNLLNYKCRFWAKPYSGAIDIQQNMLFNMTSAKGMSAQLIYNNSTWAVNCGTTVGNLLWNTDYVTFHNEYNPIFESPDGVFDVDTVMKTITNINNYSTSPYGFFYANTSIVSIGGVTFNGYGVLMQADGTRYWLLEIIPDDAFSSAWRTQGSAPTFKVDQNGYLFIKTPNNHTTLYASSDPLSFQPTYTQWPKLELIRVPHNDGMYR